MTLSLPADAERHLPSDAPFQLLRGPGVYVLELDRPRDAARAWDAEYEHRPAWFDRFATAEEVVYVGSSLDVLGRLTDHADGEKRLTVLTEVCEIDGIRNIYWHAGADREGIERKERETARLYRQEHPNWFVRQA